MNRRQDATWRPRLRPGVIIAPAGSERWQARWDFDEVTFLSGKACNVVLPWLPRLLDGSRTIVELQLEAAGRCDPNELSSVLDCLNEQGLLAVSSLSTVEPVRESESLSELARACDAIVSDDPVFLDRLSTIRIAVCGRSSLAERIVRAMSDNGLVSLQTDLTAALDTAHFGRGRSLSKLPVVLETDWRPQELEAFNALAVEQRQPWLLVAAWNRRVLVGPLFEPCETGCYICYRQRLASHREYFGAYLSLDEWLRAREEPPESQPLLPALADLAAAWSALEVFAFVTRVRPCRIRGRILVYQPDETRLDLETVLRVPWCGICAVDRAHPETVAR